MNLLIPDKPDNGASVVERLEAREASSIMDNNTWQQ